MGSTKSHIINLGNLSVDDCWLIIRKITFIDENIDRHKDLEPLGRKLANKCHGLPLAAKLIGGYMCNKRRKEQWEKWYGFYYDDDDDVVEVDKIEDSNLSVESGRTSCSWSSQNLDDVEAEMRRLKLELKQTMDMYSTACKEALIAKQKASELHHWKLTEERKFEEAKHSEEVALAIAEKERARSKIAMETSKAANRIAELESQKRANAEIRALKEAAQAREVLDNLARSDLKYRRYTFEEIKKATNFFAKSQKIGEGGYGPVYRCYLDHTPVAVKVLHLDAAHGRSQFQQEIDILSCIRHPNMVLLLGTCPEFGILVYEYMANGKIATGLLFLHETKPEPMVHHDLKPGNILLDHNYVSKISDVGLARLVPTVAENATQYHMTSI
ncbi:hypothetical protein CMV_009938 [Castanea mollissima]|uniref:RING-type E3 ubiquitin transferase n=1 Tax=Castanea mollissima TaxID=60419 RepID=A0A8J4VMF3_9ROSI|nr:hypothetical protein CMV_009938 [Castanea mollissima]